MWSGCSAAGVRLPGPAKAEPARFRGFPAPILRGISPAYWYRKAIARAGRVRETGLQEMSFSDAIYLLFLLVCAWLALVWDSEGGGGKRARLPLRP